MENIFCDNPAGTDDDIVADMYPAKDNDIADQPDVIPDVNAGIVHDDEIKLEKIFYSSVIERLPRPGFISIVRHFIQGCN